MKKSLEDESSSFLDFVSPKINKMGLIVDLRGGCFVYTQAFNMKHACQRFVPETLLTYQLSGRTLVDNEQGEIILSEGQMLISRRYQLAKTTAMPLDDKKCQRVTVILSVERLQKFALENAVNSEEKYTGKKMILMEPDIFLKNYFTSLISYSDLWSDESDKLATIKVNEAIELLLTMRPDLKSFLFDFADPHKQDLEAFMLKNFRYNVSLEQFAKLSGRSLTSFKREFAEVFNTSPANWLKNKRLSEAFHLINEKGIKPDDIYFDLGFENLSHFYTAFKQRYGMTPSEINSRKQNNSEKLFDNEPTVA